MARTGHEVSPFRAHPRWKVAGVRNFIRFFLFFFKLTSVTSAESSGEPPRLVAAKTREDESLTLPVWNQMAPALRPISLAHNSAPFAPCEGNHGLIGWGRRCAWLSQRKALRTSTDGSSTEAFEVCQQTGSDWTGHLAERCASQARGGREDTDTLRLQCCKRRKREWQDTAPDSTQPGWNRDVRSSPQWRASFHTQVKKPHTVPPYPASTGLPGHTDNCSGRQRKRERQRKKRGWEKTPKHKQTAKKKKSRFCVATLWHRETCGPCLSCCQSTLAAAIRLQFVGNIVLLWASKATPINSDQLGLLSYVNTGWRQANTLYSVGYS